MCDSCLWMLRSSLHLRGELLRLLYHISRTEFEGGKSLNLPRGPLERCNVRTRTASSIPEIIQSVLEILTAIFQTASFVELKIESFEDQCLRQEDQKRQG